MARVKNGLIDEFSVTDHWQITIQYKVGGVKKTILFEILLFLGHMGQRGPTVVRFAPRFLKNPKRVLFFSGLNFSKHMQ